MNTNLIFVGLTFLAAILYIMRRRVRLGRRKPTF
jgi:LPXTG-motif cell wall-anchored protein